MNFIFPFFFEKYSSVVYTQIQIPINERVEERCLLLQGMTATNDDPIGMDNVEGIFVS